MHRLNKVLGVALPLVLCAAAAAQQDQPTFRTETRLVVLHASVVNKKGKLVMNLPESAFKVYENGAQQTLKIFRQEDVPVSMGIIVYNSGSMREKRATVETAALDLVKASNPQDEVFIVNFNDTPYLDAPLTNDMSKLQAALERIDSRGGTAMRDAIQGSLDYLKKNGKKDKKVLIVVTDGNDNSSTETLEKLVDECKESRSQVLIYAIGLLGDEEPRDAKKAKRALDVLTESSGGLAYYPKDLAEVDRICLEVAHEIRNQYTLAYTPLNDKLDGTFRQVKVTVDAPGHPTVRTRTGYYATAEPAKLSENPVDK